MQSVIKIEDKTRFELPIRHIFGLNIFQVNKTTGVADPRVMFLRTLSEEYSCAAHIGTLALEGDQPSEFFGHPAGKEYMRSLVGLENGLFYLVKPEMAASFFPVVRSSLLKRHSVYLLTYDALALYVKPHDALEQTLTATQKILKEPPLFEKAPPIENHKPSEEYWAVIYRNQERWLQAVLDIYSLVVLSGDDGWALDVYARREAEFDLISSALSAAIQVIESAPWYQKHKGSLVWNDYLDLCLKIKP